ncbi:MAG: aldo/keto reductase [Bacteroidales bacterium]|nr:aldo/keto reductase [Bacteroidales bacterium]
MQYNDFKDLSLSRLGFGTMRLPTKEGAIDTDLTTQMIDYALEHGINYFDTAYPYMGSMSEIVVGQALARHPREKFFLADKFPGHQIAETYYPEEIFEEQLQKCKVDYFDFYLLHNIYENSFFVYTDPQWHIIPYFIEQKKKGRIRHLGFSCHANIETLRKFLDLYGDVMEFCQIQLNYLDWTLQKAKAKYDLLTERGIPVWVMEPVRGGKLANLPEEDRQKLAAIRPDESAAAWAFRWLTSLPNVKMILSGMSNLPQMEDNVKTFSTDKPLNDNEIQMLFDIAEKMKDSVPCTACRYCCDGCPMQLDIPMLMQSYNDLHFATSLTPVMQIEALPEEKRPSACIACGACASACPQKIDIPDIMTKLSDLYSKQPSWASMCKERAEEAKRAKR